MRDRYTIKTEIDEAQHHLEKSLHELREAVTDKVDVRAKLERGVHAGKEKALDTAVRIREVALDLAAHARAFLRDHPAVIAGVLGGAVVLTGLLVKIRRELREPERLRLTA